MFLLPEVLMTNWLCLYSAPVTLAYFVQIPHLEIPYPSPYPYPSFLPLSLSLPVALSLVTQTLPISILPSNWL